MNPKRYLPILLLGGLPLSTQALNLAQDPLFIASTEPRIMLLLSRDHELYKKAYTDYSDLDPIPDGVLETTYKDSIEYYGYFDSRRCYTYSTTNNRFEPGAASTGTNSHHCSGEWSGNFLNWATMTRMDIVRKVLYGGLRSTDNAGSALGDTVLQRALLPSDVHAFAKVFAPPGGSAEVALYIPSSAHSANEVTLCNVTRPSMPSTGGSVGQGRLSRDINTATDPPKVRIASGSWGQWAASEIIQCRVDSDTSGGNTATTRPASAVDYSVNVAVCVPNKLEANCKTYPSGAVKPTGLLQKYGDTDAERPVRFGLMTGSYEKNKSGGVLRRNTSKIAGNATASENEINSNTGQFTGNLGVIDTLNRLRISNFQFGDRLNSSRRSNQYFENPPGSGSGGCQSPGSSTFTEGQCPDWGNPLSEMYFEALRYFAGKTGPTSGYATTDSSYLASPLPSATWSDPLPSTEWCALSNIIVLSTGLNSFDGGLFTDPPTGINVDTLTDAVGTAEGLANASVLIGDNNTSPTPDKQCTAKTIGNLSDAKGICPEMPSTEGTYKIAGLAYANRTVDLRPSYATQRNARWNSGTNPINPAWGARQPMGTYSVALAENLPEFSVTTQSGAKIKFLPACQAHGGWTPCTLTDVRVLSTGTTGGSFLAVWEDSQWGYDYDMDAISRVDWCLGSACTPAVASNQVKFTVSIPQKVSGAGMRFGVITTGTTSDGISSMLTDNTPPPGYTCTDAICSSSTSSGGYTPPTPINLTYTAGSSAALTLQNPLWYAAKYGAPASSWDLKNNNTGAATADGIPDHFFEVRNPGTLGPALAEVFDAASQPDASAASVATNSTNLRIESRIYQARFSSADWSGQLLQYQISTAGVLAANSEWDAGALLQSATGRKIITKGTSDGVAFQWGNLTSAQQTALNTNASSVNDGLGSNRVTYLRGTDVTGFRARASSKLGDIVNSNPWYVARPDAGYSDVDHPGYSAFRTTYANRTPVVYVGGNDGMLHGFDASLDFSTVSTGVPTTSAGTEVLAYIPSAVYGNLSRLTALNYNKNHRYFVDGSPMIADVDLDSTATNDWRTLLIGGLGAGGKGYFALDVTNPASFSESGTAPADTLLWEFDETDMGNAFNMPPAILKTNQAKQIVKLANGKWAAVVGNGYNSASGKAVLYVIHIEDGVDGTWSVGDFVKIVADAPVSPATNSNNGLSTPVPFDSNGDGYADTVYAGDLKGNLWKFLIGPNGSDASVTANPSTWKIAFSTSAWNAGTYTLTCSPCKPLFVATNASSQIQPITWPPEVTLHPYGGQMVLFGTGKYLESGDNGTSQVQSFYGIWDWHDGTDHSIARADLLAQTVTSSVIGSNTYRTPSANTITWRGLTCVPPYAGNCNVGSHMGWYMDLPTSGERLTGIPKLEAGTIFFNTFIPSTSPCAAGGTGWLMTLDYINGGLLSFPLFDTNNDGVVNASDTLVGGLQIGAALGGTTLIQGVGAGSTGVGVSSLTSGSMTTTLINFGPGSRGRISWREIIQ
ncbi:MAG: Tfp pilus assembly protein tip-associated adhesin PilY1 [bacterium]|nr:MAG: Tfp pilus assembly protein tip-associated adhesin PilY1 [bacterium]KAF0147849.1 MAG: Tfp pilus assembly protein tip-associated adhesin PilY1 [bacterium]KAF0167451.1 MAG: Tfp pilus assembly protein tip-associated adhesin PilY1 [bacterium]TXT17820.1 MAG: Tfp pilus assembly protein tip-associated adhesin PilY1 [bacterium]